MEVCMKKEKKLDASGHRKFGIRDSIAYAAGDLGCNMSFALKSTMSIFWTQFMGMDLWYALLLIVVQVWDAINDPLIGSIIDSDKRKYKRNKFLAYIWLGSIGLIVYSLHSFFRKLAQGIGPSLVLVIMVAFGYVGADEGNQAWNVAVNMRYIVAATYMVSAVMQFVGLGLIYNLNKKTLAKMNKDLGRDIEDSAPVAEISDANN